MKQLICIASFILLNQTRTSSQHTGIGHVDQKIWKTEIEKVVFGKVMDRDSDSLQFVEVFLVFQEKQNSQQGTHIFLLFENGLTDSLLNKSDQLYKTSFFKEVISPKLASKESTYFIQPLLFGKTKFVNESVIDPIFYAISKLPTLSAIGDYSGIKTVFFSKQLNYIYTVGK